MSSTRRCGRAVRARLALVWGVVGLTVLSGCAWVELAPEAEAVRVAQAEEVADCQRVGTTKARSRTRIGIFARSEEKVAEELATLARNDAPELGGNTVVADGPVSQDGVQRFTVYACP